jgi:hypothetical protein
LVADPLLMKHVHGWAAIFFIVLTPISWSLGWLSLVEYVSALSIWALVAAHWSAWQSARIEVKQDKEQGNGGPGKA